MRKSGNVKIAILLLIIASIYLLFSSFGITGNAVGFSDGDDTFFEEIMKIFSGESQGTPISSSGGEEGGTEGGGTDTLCSSITQRNITWYFNQTTTCGQFANGDWWALGPITIVSTTPQQTTNPARHGSWVNPRFHSSAGGQPFDDRIGAQNFDIGTIGAIPPPGYSSIIDLLGAPYNSSLRPTFPLAVNSPISLLSTRSQTTNYECDPGSTPTSTYYNHGWYLTEYFQGPPPCQRWGLLKDAEVLTILTQTPPEGSFRPAYFGTNKTVSFNKNQLDYSILGNLVPPSPLPLEINLANFEKIFRHVNVQVGYQATETQQPTSGYPGYGQAFGNVVTIAAVLLNMNYSISQKENLTIYLTQMGIDFYGALNNRINPDYAWFPGGGHGSGRLFPILFAGKMLNDTNMSRVRFNLPQISPTTKPRENYFGETAQVFEVTSYPVSTPNWVVGGSSCASGGTNCQHGGYSSTDIGLPEWGITHWHGGMSSDSNTWTGGYRLCCTGIVWSGYALASYVMNMTDLWDYDIFFAYVDRYMEATNPSSPYFKTQAGSGWRVNTPFIGQMWDAYRANYGKTWTEADICTEGATRACAEQRGVCLNSVETCEMKNWWGCGLGENSYSPTNYLTHNSSYEVTETLCDSLDNDCDGFVDEGCTAGPGIPSNLVVTPLSTSQIRLNWADTLNEDNYVISRRQLPSGIFANIAYTGQNIVTFTDGGLALDTSYEYKVLANNSYGVSNWSNLASATTFVCTNGQQRACSLITGVCAGSFETCTGGQWPGCSATNYGSRYSIDETGDLLCRDGYDNDCDSPNSSYITKDYDTASRNGQPSANHSDDGCAVGITGISVPSSVCYGQNVTLICSSTVNNIQGVWGWFNGASNCVFQRWNGNNIESLCINSTRTENASCSIAPTSTSVFGMERRTQTIIVDDSPTCLSNPILQRIDPSRITNNQTNTIILNGSGFSSLCGVEVGGVFAGPPFITNCISSTQINFTIPLGVPTGEYALNVVGDYSGQIRRSASINVSVELPVSGVICGDGTCSSTESCLTCSADCGTCLSGNTGGNNGGGGGGSPGSTIEANLDIRNSQTLNLTRDNFLKIIFGGKSNQLRIGSVSGNVLTLSFVGVNRNVLVSLGQETEINLDNSSEMDAKIKLENIFSTIKVKLTIAKIIRTLQINSTGNSQNESHSGSGLAAAEKMGLTSKQFWIILTVLTGIAIIAISYLLIKRHTKRIDKEPQSTGR